MLALLLVCFAGWQAIRPTVEGKQIRFVSADGQYVNFPRGIDRAIIEEALLKYWSDKAPARTEIVREAVRRDLDSADEARASISVWRSEVWEPLIGGAALLVLAICSYCLTWVVGWIIAGFLGDGAKGRIEQSREDRR